MAKYRVMMSCGHEETVQLFGPMAERDRKIAWLKEHGTCSACYKAQKDAEKAAQTAAAATKASEENLPALTGSEKQINWALTIRANKLADLEQMFGAFNAKVTDEQMRSKNQIAYQAARNVLASKGEAKYWIDNRNINIKSLVASLKAEFSAEIERLTAAEAAKVVEADPDEYAVSTDAQDAAVEAETELAAVASDKQTAIDGQTSDISDEHNRDAVPCNVDASHSKPYTTPLAYDLTFVDDNGTNYTFVGGTKLTISAEVAALKINGKTVAVYDSPALACTAAESLYNYISNYLNGYNDFFFGIFDWLKPSDYVDIIHEKELLDAVSENTEGSF